ESKIFYEKSRNYSKRQTAREAS
ncbi:hypothetical protein AVEN_105926-1, partial [Araneus ventricosus]